jgi:hypothetical protein
VYECPSRLAHNMSTDHNKTLVTFRTLYEKFKSTAAINLVSDLRRQLEDLLVSFELVKGQLDPFARRQLRDEFLQLASNRYDDLTDEITRLADQAFTLPERTYH